MSHTPPPSSPYPRLGLHVARHYLAMAAAYLAESTGLEEQVAVDIYARLCRELDEVLADVTERPPPPADPTSGAE